MTFSPDNSRGRLLAGVAAAGLVVAAFGSTEVRGDHLYNPHVRVDEVVDSHGEPWTVLIVPRVFTPPCNTPQGPVGVLHVPAPAAENAAKPEMPATGEVFTAFQANKKDSKKKDEQKKADRKRDRKKDDRKKEDRKKDDRKDGRKQEDRKEEKKPAATKPEVIEEVEPEVVDAAASESEMVLPAGQVAMGRAIDPHDYWRIYTSLPFVRSEYDANPSYRHEAAMEILFGQMRPTVNVKQQAPPVRRTVVSPAALRAAFGYDLFPDGYTQVGPYGSYFRPWGVGYPGAYWTLPPYFGSSRLSGFSYAGAYGISY